MTDGNGIERNTGIALETGWTGATHARDLVHLEHVRKSFGDKVALKDISFTVPTGQICGLLAPTARVRRHYSAC